MDPTVVYELMMAAWEAGNIAKAKEHAASLTVWLAGGGYAPAACRFGTKDWISYISGLSSDFTRIPLDTV